MKDYRLLVPVGGALPQAGKVIQVTEDGNAHMVMVSSVRSVTWGTAKRKTPPHDEVVAGVFVDFWGVPWPPIILPEDMKRRKRKHVVVYGRATGDRYTCFNSDDVMDEVPEDSCPLCVAKEQEQANQIKETADAASMAAMKVLTDRYGDNGLDDAIPDLCRAIYKQVKQDKQDLKDGNGLVL